MATVSLRRIRVGSDCLQIVLFYKLKELIYFVSADIGGTKLSLTAIQARLIAP